MYKTTLNENGKQKGDLMKISRTYTLDLVVIQYLEKLPNQSAYINDLIWKDINKNKATTPR